MQSNLRLAFNCATWSPSRSEWMLAGKCIQVEERKRISEFHYKNDAKLCLIGRLLLRYAISLSTSIPWKNLQLVRSERSKPMLHSSHNCNISFNASHQGDYVVVVTDQNSVGVDVMDVRERHGNTEEFFSLMTRQFTDDEWQNIKRFPDTECQMKAFYRHWCLKESYVKALGDGITFPLLSLSFNIHSSLHDQDIVTDTLLFKNGKQEGNWCFEESMIDKNHVVAVAQNVNKLISVKRFKTLTFDDILLNAEHLDKECNIDETFFLSFNKPFKKKRWNGGFSRQLQQRSFLFVPPE